MSIFYCLQHIVTISLFCLSAIGFGMEQKETKADINKKIENKLVDKRIRGHRIIDNILTVNFHDQDENFIHNFYLSSDRNGNMVFSFIGEEFHEKLGNYYRLLEAAKTGNREEFKNSQLSIGESITDYLSIKDLRWQRLLNIKQQSDGLIMTKETFDKHGLVPGSLVWSKEPSIAPSPWDWFGRNAFQYAWGDRKIDILEQIINDPVHFNLADEDRKKVVDYLDRAKNEIKSVPAFLTQFMQEFSGKPQSDLSDLVSLGKECATMIALKEKEGDLLLTRFNEWKEHELLMEQVLQSLSELVCAYPNEPLMLRTTNLADFSWHVIRDQKTCKLPKSEKFVANLLTLSLRYSQDGKNNEFKNVYDSMVDLLAYYQTGRKLLKKLCDDENNEKMFNATVKPVMQKNKLKQCLKRQLQRANPPFPEDLAIEIANVWEPGNEYKQYFRDLKNNKRVLEDNNNNTISSEKRSKQE